MEIERKFLIREVPSDLETYRYTDIEQGYLCRRPVVRVRKAGDDYILTYKGSGKMVREEVNMPLDAESFAQLRLKTDGQIVKKRRYYIPYGKYTIELDHFEEPRRGLYMAEVEFGTEEEALSFTGPDWFGDDVTQDPFYHNSNM